MGDLDAQLPVRVLQIVGIQPGQTPLIAVSHDASLSGSGTVASPLAVVGTVTGTVQTGVPQGIPLGATSGVSPVAVPKTIGYRVPSATPGDPSFVNTLGGATSTIAITQHGTPNDLAVFWVNTTNAISVPTGWTGTLSSLSYNTSRWSVFTRTMDGGANDSISIASPGASFQYGQMSFYRSDGAALTIDGFTANTGKVTTLTNGPAYLWPFVLFADVSGSYTPSRSATYFVWSVDSGAVSGILPSDAYLYLFGGPQTGAQNSQGGGLIQSLGGAAPFQPPPLLRMQNVSGPNGNIVHTLGFY